MQKFTIPTWTREWLESSVPWPCLEQLRMRVRPETPSDSQFLKELYLANRHDEFLPSGLDGPMRAQLIGFQFHAQDAGYRQTYPNAVRAILISSDQPCGRLLLDVVPERISIVDVAFIPDQQSRGIGTALFRDLQAMAKRINLPIELRVVIGSRSQRFYSRLGFVEVQSDDVRILMQWQPSR